MLAPQPVKPGPTKSTGPRPGWGGSLDLNEENDRRALITARMYGLVIARRNSGRIAFGRAKAPHKLVDQVDAADQQDRELGTWRDEMMQQMSKPLTTLKSLKSFDRDFVVFDA
jgi:hypothetical protein